MTKPLIYRFRPCFVEREADWTTIEVCPICGGQEQLLDIASIQGEQDRSLTTAACLDCQFVFFRRRPSIDWYQRFFSSDWDQSGQQRQGKSRTKPIYVSVLRSGRSLAKKVLMGRDPAPTARGNAEILKYCEDILEPSFRILDIGCGYGTNLHRFQQRGYDVFGIEPSKHRQEYVREVMNLPSANLGVEGLLDGGVDGPFDLAYSNHVLDHLYDPNTYFQALRQVLRPGGYGYITIPDLYSGQYFPQTFHYAAKPSIFTLESLSRLINKHGFKVVKSYVGTDIQVLFRFDDGAEEDCSGSADGTEFFLDSLFRELKGVFSIGSSGDGTHSPYRLLGWRLSDSEQQEAVEAVPLDSNWLRVLFTKICLTSPSENGPMSMGERIFTHFVTTKFGTRFMLLQLPSPEESQRFAQALADADPNILPLEFIHRSDRAPVWVK